MARTDDDDAFDGDVDIGELLAESESLGDPAQEYYPETQTNPMQTSSSKLEAQPSHHAVGPPKYPRPRLPRSALPRHRKNPAQPQYKNAAPQLETFQNNAKQGLPIISACYIRSPYLYDRPERVIFKKYLSSSELTRSAQLPSLTYPTISAHGLVVDGDADYDVICSGNQADDNAMRDFYKLNDRVIQSYYYIIGAIERLLGLISGAQAGHKPLIGRLELLDIYMDNRMRIEQVSAILHDLRRVMRQRRQCDEYLRLGPEFPYSKEASLLSIKHFQASEPFERLRQSLDAISRAYVVLKHFYDYRQMRSLRKRVAVVVRVRRRRKLRSEISWIRPRALYHDVFLSFRGIYKLKEEVIGQVRLGRGYQLAFEANRSLSQLTLMVRRLTTGQIVQSLERSPFKARTKLTTRFYDNYKGLEKAIYDYNQFQMYIAARHNAMTARPTSWKDMTVPDAMRPVCRSAGRRKQDNALSPSMARFGIATSSKSPGNVRFVSSKMTEHWKRSKTTTSGHGIPVTTKFLRIRKHDCDARIYRYTSSGNIVNIRRTSGTSNGQQKSLEHGCTSASSTIESTLGPNVGLLAQCRTASSNVAFRPILSAAIQPLNPDPRDAASEESLQSAMSAALPKHSSHSPRGYSMNYDGLDTVTKQGTPSKPAYWSYTLYTGPKDEKVKVHYCKNKADTERIAQLFLDQDIIGFDIEWKPNAQAKDGVKRNVSLIQLACEERVALFHIARYHEDDSVDCFVAPTLKAIMESPNVSKVGVAIKGDCTRLRRFMGIESRGLFELSHSYKLVKFSENNVSSIDKKLVRLATQVEEHLGLPLCKGNARMSDWSLDLNIEQVQYAASDSYAGFQLFHTLEHKRKLLSPTPPRPRHAELNLPIEVATGQPIETDNEAEAVEEELLEPYSSGESPSFEELARDFMKIKLACPVLTAAKTAKRSAKSGNQQSKPEVAAANEWVAQWRTTLAQDYKPTAAPACLRAHALWHEQGITVPEAAALLRDPPLLDATVAGYVLDALKAEKLPFEKERLAALLLHISPAMKERYKRFFEQAGINVE